MENAKRRTAPLIVAVCAALALACCGIGAVWNADISIPQMLDIGKVDFTLSDAGVVSSDGTPLGGGEQAATETTEGEDVADATDETDNAATTEGADTTDTPTGAVKDGLTYSTKLAWQEKCAHSVNVTNTGEKCWLRAKSDLSKDDETYGPLEWSMVDGSFLNSEEWMLADDGYFYYLAPVEENAVVTFTEAIQTPMLLVATGDIVPSNEVEEWFEADAQNYTRSLGGTIASLITVDAIQYANFTPDFSSASPWGDVTIKTTKTIGGGQ